MKKKFDTVTARIKQFADLHPHWTTIIVLSLLIVIFLSPALFQGRFLAPVDIQRFIPPYLDITTQMLPWYKLSGMIINQGHFPVWNIYSGFGLPLFANMQSSVLFPLTWVFYIFNIKVALLLYSYGKLLLAGFFTYLYLREIKIRYSVSLLGGILFTFCGVNVIWFLWPLTSVIIILPLSLLLIEKYFKTNNFKFALLLSPVIALGLFAGHPQTFFYIFFAIYGYAAFKSWVSEQTWKNRIIRLFTLSFIFLLGFLISAVAVIPFLEYVKLSANIDYRSGFTENPFYLTKNLFLANFIPDFYGNPGVKNFSYLLTPNYGELALGYIGLSGFVLALFAWGKERRKEVVFFSVAALFTLLLIYHFPGIYQIINKLPGFNLNYNNRLLYLWAFFLIPLACVGLEKLLDGRISPKRFNYTWLIFGVSSALLIAINVLITRHWAFPSGIDLSMVTKWQMVLIVGFIANAIIAYLIFKRLPKSYGMTLLFILIVIETAIHGMIFLRTSAPQQFYPETPAIQYLQNESKDYERTFTFGHNLLPNIGTWYGVNEINDHDTIYLHSNKQLKQAIASYNYSPEYTFEEPNLNALRFYDTKFLLYPIKEGQAILNKYPDELTVGFRNSEFFVLQLNHVVPRSFIVNAANPTELKTIVDDMIKNPESHSFSRVDKFTQDLNGSQQIQYTTNTPGYLVTTDNYYPGWTAQESNGQKLEVLNINGLRAIAITSGNSTVSVEYHSRSLKLGLIITIIALLTWATTQIFFSTKGFSKRSS